MRNIGAGIVLVAFLGSGCTYTKLNADFTGIPEGAINVAASCNDTCELPGQPDGDEMKYGQGVVEIATNGGNGKLVIAERSSPLAGQPESVNGRVQLSPADYGGGGSTVFSWSAEFIRDPDSRPSALLEVHTIDVWYGPEGVKVNSVFEQPEKTQHWNTSITGKHNVTLRVDRARNCYYLGIIGDGVSGEGVSGKAFQAQGKFAPPAWDKFKDLNLTISFGPGVSETGSSRYFVDQIRVTSSKFRVADTPKDLGNSGC